MADDPILDNSSPIIIRTPPNVVPDISDDIECTPIQLDDCSDNSQEVPKPDTILNTTIKKILIDKVSPTIEDRIYKSLNTKKKYKTKNSKLPKGWTLITKNRKRGKSKGASYKIWISPDDKKFYSLRSVTRFLNLQNA